MYSEADFGARGSSSNVSLFSDADCLDEKALSADVLGQKIPSDVRRAVDSFSTARGSAERNVNHIERMQKKLRTLLIKKFGNNIPPEIENDVKRGYIGWNYRCAMEKLAALRTFMNNAALYDLESIKTEEATFINDCCGVYDHKLSNKLRGLAKDYSRLKIDIALNDPDEAKAYVNKYRANIWVGEKQLFDQLDAAKINVTPELREEILLIHQMLAKLGKAALESNGSSNDSSAPTKGLSGKRDNGRKNRQRLSQATL